LLSRDGYAILSVVDSYGQTALLLRTRLTCLKAKIQGSVLRFPMTFLAMGVLLAGYLGAGYCWGLLVLSFPIFLAYGRIQEVGLGFYAKSLTLLILFIAIPACLAGLGVTLLVRFLPLSRKRMRCATRN